LKHDRFPSIEEACTRSTDRAEVILLCEVRQGTAPFAMARLEDISPTGFRIAWLPNCTPAKPLRIKIPGLSLLSADIVWQKGKAVGCAFREPLHVAVFEHIVARARAQA
jgi:hypothetical protein